MPGTFKRATDAGVEISDPPGIENIVAAGKLLTRIVRASMRPSETTFLTPPDFTLQVGFVARAAGDAVPRHVHRPLERRLDWTGEVLLVLEGDCLMDVYDDRRELVATSRLRQGDLVMFQAGGHGFRMAADTLFLEIKQGPYTGLDEKERF